MCNENIKYSLKTVKIAQNDLEYLTFVLKMT